jgi:hypothetical protein
MNVQWLEFLLAIAVLLLPMVIAWVLVTKGDSRKRGCKHVPGLGKPARHGKQQH